VALTASVILRPIADRDALCYQFFKVLRIKYYSSFFARFNFKAF